MIYSLNHPSQFFSRISPRSRRVQSSYLRETRTFGQFKLWGSFEMGQAMQQTSKMMTCTSQMMTCINLVGYSGDLKVSKTIFGSCVLRVLQCVEVCCSVLLGGFVNGLLK